jgi:hypothetical protein
LFEKVDVQELVDERDLGLPILDDLESAHEVEEALFIEAGGHDDLDESDDIPLDQISVIEAGRGSWMIDRWRRPSDGVGSGVVVLVVLVTR